MKHNFKKFALAAGVVGTLAIAGVALADAPVLNILTITGANVDGTWAPGNDLTVTSLPSTVSVGGTVTHDQNLNPVNAVKLYVNDVLTGTQVVPNGSGNTFNFSLPWTITTAGNYTLKVTAKHGNCGDCTGMDEETLTVINLGGGGGGNPGVNCPAAPAIGGAYMKAHNVKAGSAKWKSVITYLASQTGNGGTYWAKYACGGGIYADQAAYRAAVEAYVASQLL
jgi:hypothetical protein